MKKGGLHILHLFSHISYVQKEGVHINLGGLSQNGLYHAGNISHILHIGHILHILHIISIPIFCIYCIYSIFNRFSILLCIFALKMLFLHCTNFQMTKVKITLTTWSAPSSSWCTCCAAIGHIGHISNCRICKISKTICSNMQCSM
jgi:hypothetical protein